MLGLEEGVIWSQWENVQLRQKSSVAGGVTREENMKEGHGGPQGMALGYGKEFEFYSKPNDRASGYLGGINSVT